MIGKIVEFSVRNRFIVLLGVGALSLWGVWALYRTPIDAIPDLSENQVIVWADWPGRSPKEVEDQITYPLSVNLQGLAGVKAVRATSEFGFSMINIIFEDEIDFYFARQRVLERLSTAGSFLPMGVVPYLAPDATALGQIFWYTVEGDAMGLDELRSVQDWYVRYQLNAVPGVAQVSSVGGFVREYQVDVDPARLRAFNLSLGEVFAAVQRSNSSVGGKVIHKGGAEYLVRGYGWLRSIEDLRKVVVAERNGVPITVEELGTVQLGPAFRRSVLEKDGREAVGGVVMMRYGENPLEVTDRIKAKIQELQPGLPPGVRIVPFYDRTGLIQASIGTLRGTLVEEIVVASIVVFLVLWHLRSAFVICVTLPLAVLVSFIFMYYLKIPSNIMSLSGIAISIGVLIDAGIVMVENAYHRLHDRFKDGKVAGDTRPIVIDACKVVAGPLFFSIVIMLLSFAPVFVLGGMEGRMFNPLAYTKTFALVGVAILAITLVPALIPAFLRGKLKSQEDVWLVRSFVNVYRPLLDFFIRQPDVIVVITGLFLLWGLPIFPREVPYIFFILGVPFLIGLSVLLVARHKLVCFLLLFVVAVTAWKSLRPMGREFMPPLNELAIMDMPTTRPNVNITQAGDDLRKRDVILRQFPEVHQVVGKIGRAETPTDPAPVDMVETVVSFRPEAWWPKRKIDYDLALATAGEVVHALRQRSLVTVAEKDFRDFANTATMDAVVKFDRAMRELSKRRLLEFVPEKGRELARLLRRELMDFLRKRTVTVYACPLHPEVEQDAPGTCPKPHPKDRSKTLAARERKVLLREPTDAEWARPEERLVDLFASSWDEWILPADVTRATNRLETFLKENGYALKRPDLLVQPPGLLDPVLDPIRSISGVTKPSLYERLRRRLEERNDELVRQRVRRLNVEIEQLAPGTLVWFLLEEARAKAKEQKLLARDVPDEELHPLRDRLAADFARGAPLTSPVQVGKRSAIQTALGLGPFLWKKSQADLQQEMDSELQVPGWGNIWTKPIQNRVDMLATGVRTQVGVKISGKGKTLEETLGGLQKLAQEVADALKAVPGAVDVFPDQIVGENYLEITTDREKAARYGVSVEEIQNVVEVALGGKDITMTVEGRERYPVRVRYPRYWREDEERVKSVLVSASPAPASGMAGMADGARAVTLRQVPLSLVADIKVVPGPSMIKSENGLLRAYVQLNVRDRDVIGFVEEARQAVEANVKRPEGYTLDWTGQFEHEERAKRTLTFVFPVVILIIFVILYLTYKDLADTFMMFLAVPGAVAGGAIAQWLGGVNFSVAVWVGYIACFGLATETAIVMLVYLREAIAKRGGLEGIRSEAELKDAVMEGAVHRLRPKLLTEGTTVLALIPMLWATGVGAEFMSPMALPILGGILVADEVIDIFIPVLFFWERRRRWKKIQEGRGREARGGVSFSEGKA